MNKVYKVIWSKARNCYVVVSEMAKSNAKGSGVTSSRTKAARVLGMLLLCACLTGGYNIQAAHAEEDDIKEAGVAGTNVTRAGYSNASAWGNSTIAKGTNSTAWGIGSQALGINSTAFGDRSVAKGTNSLAALGGTAVGMHSFAIGTEAVASMTNSVAMGSYSVANRAAGVAGFSPSGSTVTGNAWVATQSAIAVGASANDSDAATVTRQITGVAAGTFDTDAVNVAQLKSAMKNAGSGQTYTAGDGIEIDKASNKISVKSGEIASDADGFAKAAAVFMEVRPHSDGTYVKKAYSTGQNLAILDEQVKQTGGALKEEIENRTKAVQGEAAARISEDAALSNRIGSLSANGQYIKVTNDVAANLAALDSNLATGLKTEIRDRQTAVSNESKARESADAALSNRIGSLSANGNYIVKSDSVSKNLSALDAQLKDATTDLQTEIRDRKTAVSNESKARESADAALSNRIGSLSANGYYIVKSDSVSKNLSALDAQLKGATTGLQTEIRDRQTAVSNESKARESADTALSNRIGSLSANGNYIVKSDSVSKNLSALDTQLKGATTGLQTEIMDRQTAVSNESKARESADTALSNRIGSLSKDGSYIKQKYDISYNMTLLDTQLKAADTAIQALTDADIATIEVMAEYVDVVVENKRNIQTNAGDIINLNKKTTDLEAAQKTETSERMTADKALEASINKEVSDRITADAALSDRIGTLAEDGNVIRKDSSVSDNLALLDQVLQDQVDINEEILENKANADASNVGKNAKPGDNSEAWGSALGTGAVESGDGKLVTGDTVYNEVRTDFDGTYIKADNTAAENLTALDDQMTENTEAIVQNTEDIQQNAADIEENQKQIAQNTEDIQQNAADIEENQKQIAQNTENIETNTKNIMTNRNDIAVNATNIAANAKNISQVKTTADSALHGVSALLIGTDLNLEDIIATDQKIDELAAQNGVIDKSGAEGSDEFVRGNTVYEYLNGKPGEENAAVTLGQNAERIAIGKGSEATGENSIAIGTGIKVHGKRSGAIGDPGDVFGDDSYVIGNNPKVSGNGTFVVGNDANVTGANNFVLGHKAEVTGKNNIVLGNDVAIDNVDNAIVIGNGSKAEADAVSVGSDKEQRQIKHVKAGTDPTDAATFGQVNSVAQSVSRLDTKLNKVGAGAAALAALHPVEMDNKFGIGLGYGNYRDAHAMALGLFYRPKDNLMFSIGGSMANGENLVNAGISIALDKGFTNSKAVMARKIAAQDDIIAAQGAELEAQKKENAEQRAEIQALKEALARLEAKIGK